MQEVCICGSNLEPIKKDVAYKGKVFPNVPALLCSKCGEIYVPRESYKALEVTSLLKPKSSV